MSNVHLLSFRALFRRDISENTIDALTALHLNVFLLSVLAFFAFFTVPRAAARFCRIAEWKGGYFLNGAARFIVPTSSDSCAGSSITDTWSDSILSPVNPNSESESQHYTTLMHQSTRPSEALSTSSQCQHCPDPDLRPYTFHGPRPKPPHMRTESTDATLVYTPYDDAESPPKRSHSYLHYISSYPLHVKSPSSLMVLHPIIRILRRRISPGFPVGQLLLLVSFAVGLAFASFLRSNPFREPMRTGCVAISLLPWFYALGARNNLIGALADVGHETISKIYRFTARATLLLGCIHGFGYIYLWSVNSSLSGNLHGSQSAMGILALVVIFIMTITSITLCRRRWYNAYSRIQDLGVLLLLPALGVHAPKMKAYAFIALALYSLDLCCRMAKTRLCTGHITAVPLMHSTRLEIPRLNTGWRAGQHVRVRVLSSGIGGWLGWSQSHPFIIASAPGHPAGLVLLCKKSGSWTKNLYKMANTCGFSDLETASRNVVVTVEGPYGGPGHTIFASYSAAVLVVGGSGISFAMSVLQELIQKDMDGTSRLKAIELIWCVQDPTCLIPLLPLFEILFEGSVSPVHVSLFHTRPMTSSSVFPPKEGLPQGITVNTGRPRLEHVLDAVMATCVTLGVGTPKDEEFLSGVVVGVCGPQSLTDNVWKAVDKIDQARKDSVGGIEVHQESFEI